MNTSSISIYIHYPWCLKKCPYCDFNSHTLKPELSSEEAHQEYTLALIADFQQQQQQFPELQQRNIHSIFIGGGTPSLCPPKYIKQLIDYLIKATNTTQEPETTIEMNPGTVDNQHLAGYREAGINRLSIGCQSFNNLTLLRLGRIHQKHHITNAIAKAKEYGFQNINLDLMYGLPGQTLAKAESDLHQALDSQVQHISYYQLTLEPNTQFFQKPPSDLPDDEECNNILDTANELFQQHHFQNYEISAWASNPNNLNTSNLQSQHNLNYWNFGDYLGIGAGAHGKISYPDGTADDIELHIIRTQRTQSPARYLLEINQNQPITQRPTHGNDRLFEYLLNRLRLNQPFSLEQMQQATGLTEDYLLQKLTIAVDQDFLSIQQQGPSHPTLIHKTQLGNRFLNNCLTLFL